jgi:WD40-like Beta Propeller Repeat
VLMALPVCVLVAILLQRKRYGWLAALLVVYFAIGLPTPSPHGTMGPAVPLYLLRLPLMFALLIGIYVLLWRDRRASDSSRDWTRYAWAAAMAGAVVFSALSTFHRERAVRLEYAYRLPLLAQGLLNADPRPAGTGVRYVAFTLSGYHLVTEGRNEVWADLAPGSSTDSSADSLYDDLSFTSGFGDGRPETILMERAMSPRSRIVEARRPSRVLVDDARDPMLSADGKSLAFVRDYHGRGRLMMRKSFESDTASESALTPPSLNIYDVSFLSQTEYAFSAVEHGRPPQVYLSDATHANAPLTLGESRYPALSPDGRWMAYSRLDHGAWNLWLRDEKTGTTRRIADLPCNQIQPAWEYDSKTLLYSTDCGRSLWFTAVSRRRVTP